MQPNYNSITLAIGSDHAGFALKQEVVHHLKTIGVTVTDMGTHNTDSVDYPDFAHAVANAVATNQVPLGILICGSGQGVNITANKHHGVRSALCWTAEIATLARQHNNANILALPGRFISLADAKAMIEAFLTTPYEGGRHQLRVEKIEATVVA